MLAVPPKRTIALKARFMWVALSGDEQTFEAVAFEMCDCRRCGRHLFYGGPLWVDVTRSRLKAMPLFFDGFHTEMLYVRR